MKKLQFVIVIVIVIVIVVSGCSSLRQVQVIERVSRDTLYLNHVQYDSIYVENQNFRDYRPSLQGGDGGRPDTIYLEKSHVEYRYKLLRDTVRVVQIDTIPVIKTIEVVKTERYVPWYAKALSWIGVITLFLTGLWLVKKVVMRS